MTIKRYLTIISNNLWIQAISKLHRNVIAVVGASRNPEKYGHQVYKDLKESGYRVSPVNPDIAEVLGDKCYSDLKSLPIKPDVVNLAVPPKVTEEAVKTCKALGITKVWIQTGSESEEAIRFCNDKERYYKISFCANFSSLCT